VKPRYSVAMADSDGCIVMLLNSHVVGSMSREDSIGFANGLLLWIPPTLRASEIAVDPHRPILKLIDGGAGDVPPHSETN
jgi:hypothetical protein